MASIKETIELIEHTPVNQPIMLQGIHGIGKSESIRDHFISKGYNMITLFVGQMADAGDLIGLPDRTEVELQTKDGVLKQKFTEFCPPKWWPTDPESKVIIFFDEVNRGKPEIMQCLMDMILNRKLNGLDLPEHTRIVGAVNPLDEGYYQVEDLDPAFIDRWNIYDFRPTVDEWVDWAYKNQLHDDVISFVVRHNDHLDPPNSKDCTSGKVYPSRRSWKKVSDFLKSNTEINQNILDNYLLGVIGERSTSSFKRYRKEKANGIYAGKIITNWSDGFKKILNTMNVQDVIYMNKEVVYWFEKYHNLLNDTEAGWKYAQNLQRYLNTIPPETMAEFFNQLGDSVSAGKKWPHTLMDLNKELGSKFITIYNGEDEEEEW